MNRTLRVVSAVLSVALVVALRVVTEPSPWFPLHTIGQGVSVALIQDERVFLLREGSQLLPIRGASPVDDGPVVWCPEERIFVAPGDTSAWDRRGRYVDGPAERDLQTFPTEITTDLMVRVVVGAPEEGKRRTKGVSISGEAGESYQLFAAGEEFARFCQNPLPPSPEAVPELP